MAMTMKSLLKGLRYITQMFDDEKGSKIQIGQPTDVKHVAHIGSDCPSAMKPNWMKEYKSPELDKDILSQGCNIIPEGRTQTAGNEQQELRQQRSQKMRRKTRTSALPLDYTAYPVDAPSGQPIHHHGLYGPTDSSNDMDPSSRIRPNSAT